FRPVTLETGNQFVIYEDVTERRRVEEALQKAHDELERRVEERTAELVKANEHLRLEIEERQKAQEKYKTLVENSLTGIFIHQDGKYVFVNDRFAEIHGYQPEALMGMEHSILMHPDEREALGQIAQKRLEGAPVSPQYEVRRLRKDGTTIWCKMMATCIEYAGRPAIMGNIVDITKRKQALAAVRQRDETLSGIISSMTDHMSLIDNEFNILWANSFAEQSLGGDLVGKKCYSVYQGRDKACGSCVVSKCFEDGMVHEHETEVIGVAGNRMIFWHTGSVAAWYSDGRPKLAVLVSRNITERKRAEEALRERKEALKSQAQRLEEVNTALRVLLKRREEDKVELEEKVLANVKELVLPYVEALRKTRLGTKQLAYTSIIESHLKDIVSPFLRSLSSKYLGLTPREIQVAGLVKQGKTNKEIAELLTVSVRAVEFHRESIRTKLGLKHQPVNLRSFLLSFQ
ncbi:MAG TPA: PAS domain S-box protein, partial [Desulfobacterales bacterium]|nr:PAS domain S-box protein [Desulfobacterales bacterium]